MENKRKPFHESHRWTNDNRDPGGEHDIVLRELFVTFFKILLKTINNMCFDDRLKKLPGYFEVPFAEKEFHVL